MAYSTIDKPSSYFNTKLYTGTGSTQSITGVNFKPDWVWIKDRTSAYNHYLYDIIRTPLNVLQSNATDANATQTDGLSSFNSDGFSLLNNRLNVNASGDSFVAWNWLGANTTASNTSGSITSTVSANTTSGFSIATWTGAGAAGTVGHGLGKAPEFVITKKRNNTGNWACYHSSLGNTKYIYLNSTSASATYSGFWNNTSPTSTVMSLGTDDNVTGNGDSIIGYFFTSIKGYSKFGSYTGNGNADGTFVYTGFKPAFVISKITSGADSWTVWDNKRLGYNNANYYVAGNSSAVEVTSVQAIDFLSNGFKIRNSDAQFNSSGGTYIYMAFAENPFVSSKGIPTCAR